MARDAPCTSTSRAFAGSDRQRPDLRPARRLVCSGDSFTFGYGVGDEATWCALLATIPPGIETVNMGQGGYGLDQAYLWYRRDGLHLGHQVHVMALITRDFERMASDRFVGYGKPLLSSPHRARWR